MAEPQTPGTASPANKGDKNSTPAKPDRPKRKRRRFLRWSLITLTVLILLALLLPTLASTGPGRRAIVSFVNGQIRGTVQMDDLSLGWFSACRVDGLAVADPQGREVLKVSQVQWDRGLWKALWAGSDYGQLTADAPEAQLYLLPEGGVSLTTAFEPRTKKESKPGEPSHASVTVSWNKARIRTVQPDGRDYTVVELAGSLAITAMNDIRANLSAIMPGGGKLTASASVRDFNVAGNFSLDKAVGDLEVKTDPAIDLAPAVAFALGQANGQGRLTIQAKATLSGGKGSANYSVRAEGLAIPASQPGAAVPIDAEFSGDAAYENRKLVAHSSLGGKLGQIKSNLSYTMADKPVEVSADKLLAALIQGKSLALPDFMLDVDGQLDLAVASRSIPGLLQLRPDVQVTAGSLEFRGIEINGGTLPAAEGAFKLTLTTQRAGQQPSAWEPMEAKFKLAADKTGQLQLEQADLKSAFATANAKGALPEITGGFNVKLDVMAKQLGEVFDLGSLALAGELVGKLQAGRDPEDAKNPEKIAISVNVEGKNVVAESGPTPATTQPGKPPAGPKTYNGEFVCKVTIEHESGHSLVVAAGSAGIPRMVITTPTDKGPDNFDVFAADPPTLRYNLTYHLTSKALDIAEFSLTSKLLSLTVDKGGHITDLGGQTLLDLSGNYKLAWAEMNALLQRVSPENAKQFAMAGVYAAKLSVSGPLSNPTVTPKFQQMTGGTSVGWQTGSKALGLLLGDAQFLPALKDGKLVVPTNSVSANGGKLALGCSVDLTGRDVLAGPDKDSVLVIPGELQVLDNVGLTEEVGQQLLSRVLPLLGQVSKLEGKVSLRLKDVHVPLSSRVTKVGQGSGRLDLSSVQLRPAGEMAQLFKLLGMGADKPYPIKVSGLDFELKDGGLKYDNLTIVFGDKLDLKFYGMVKFDDSVSLVVSVPISASVLEGLGAKGPTAKYAKALDGVRIDIPIVGSRSQPKLGKVDVGPLITEAIKKMGTSGGGLLPGIQLPK